MQSFVPPGHLGVSSFLSEVLVKAQAVAHTQPQLSLNKKYNSISISEFTSATEENRFT